MFQLYDRTMADIKPSQSFSCLLFRSCSRLFLCTSCNEWSPLSRIWIIIKIKIKRSQDHRGNSTKNYFLSANQILTFCSLWLSCHWTSQWSWPPCVLDISNIPININTIITTTITIATIVYLRRHSWAVTVSFQFPNAFQQSANRLKL